MKKAIPIIIILLVLAGLGFLLYPTLSDLWNKTQQSQAVEDYRAAVEKMTDAERQAMWAAAEDYNRRLCRLGAPSQEMKAEYPDLLNVTGDGMMGVLEIPAIDVCLPLRHSTDDLVLQGSVGHIEISSLPVGGADTHCILSGHTGLPSARLLTDLEQMKEGDVFTLEVLGTRMSYQVDQILVVLPSEVSAIGIERGMDYCTLVTCTPYGVNSHRLLVRGVRTENSAAQAQGSGGTFRAWLAQRTAGENLAAFTVLAIIVLLLLSALLTKRARTKRSKENPAPKSAQPSEQSKEETTSREDRKSE